MALFEITEDDESKGNKLETALKDKGLNLHDIYTEDDFPQSINQGDVLIIHTGTKRYMYWQTNAMGVARINAQMARAVNTDYAGWTIIFIVLVLFTVFFALTYLKRVLYLAFLTIIAPMVAMTYPIDKMNDGKAQAFNMWLKEYIFNLLIQPMHLLLYTVLISSAFELANENIIYSLVAIGFLTPAEKLIRSFFGFEKAKTPGLLSGAAGAALAMSGLQKIMGKTPSKSSSSGSSGSSSSSSSDESTDDHLGKEKTNFNKFGGVNNQAIDVGNPQTPPGGTIDTGAGNGNPDDGGDDGNGGNSGDGGQDNDSSNGNPPPINTRSLNQIVNRNPNDTNRRQNSTSGFGNMMRNAGRSYAKGLAIKAAKSHPGKRLGRLVTGAAGGALFGMAGLAAGVASGDLNKTAQYMALGAAGGYKYSNALKDSLEGKLDVDGVTENLAKDYYGEEKWRDIQRQKRKTAWQNDESNIAKVQKYLKLSRSEAKEFLKSEEAMESFDIGMRNIDDVIRVEKMVEKNGWTRDAARGAWKIGKGKDFTSMTMEDENKHIDTIQRDYVEKGEPNGPDPNAGTRYFNNAKTFYNFDLDDDK